MRESMSRLRVESINTMDTPQHKHPLVKRPLLLLELFILINSTMKTFVVLAAIIVAAAAQYGADIREIPIPYSYNYVAEGEEGASSHQETGDGSGRVQGSYSLSDIDGRNRVVEYVADEGGFRAVVRTNEPGTANQNPADVVVESTAPDAGGIGGAVTQPRPVTRPGTGGGVPRQGGGGGTRFVLVPIDDPRARGYY